MFLRKKNSLTLILLKKNKPYLIKLDLKVYTLIKNNNNSIKIKNIEISKKK